VPKHVHFVEELPRNAMGKVEKNTLRTRYSA
jgi:malonyl-CoA/methylmalonyl-CoA synthetase